MAAERPLISVPVSSLGPKHRLPRSFNGRGTAPHLCAGDSPDRGDALAEKFQWPRNGPSSLCRYNQTRVISTGSGFNGRGTAPHLCAAPPTSRLRLGFRVSMAAERPLISVPRSLDCLFARDE